MGDLEEKNANSFSYIEIVNRIRYFRERKGMSQRALSIALERSENYIGKAESLDFKLPIDALLKMIRLLDVPPAEFFYADIADYAVDEQILSRFKSFTTEEKRALLSLLNTLSKYSVI